MEMFYIALINNLLLHLDYYRMKFFYSFLTAFTLLLSSHTVYAGEIKAGDLVIINPSIPATVKSAPVAAGYLMIKNNGTEADKLLSVSADFSAKQQLHTMTMIEGVMRMRPLKDGIEIPAGGEVKLKKGGDHLMFMQLTEQMQVGEMREVILTFEKAGEVKINMPVMDIKDIKHGEGDHSNHSGSTN